MHEDHLAPKVSNNSKRGGAGAITIVGHNFPIDPENFRELIQSLTTASTQTTDKILYFLSRLCRTADDGLIRLGAEYSRAVISSITLKKDRTRIRLIDLLKKARIIEDTPTQNGSALTKRVASYRLIGTPETRCFQISREVKSEIDRRMGNFARRRRAENPTLEWLQTSIKSVSHPDPESLLKSPHAAERGFGKLLIEGKTLTVEWNRTRYISKVCNLKKATREQLTIDGEPVFRIDINCCYFRLIPPIIAGIYSRKKKRPDDQILAQIAAYSQVFQHGDLYEHLCPDRLSKNEAKTWLNAAFNGSKHPRAQQMLREFRKHFWLIYGQLKETIACGGFTELAQSCLYDCYDSIIAELSSRKIKVLIVGDEFVVPTKDCAGLDISAMVRANL